MSDWTRGEIEVVEAAAGAAPSVHDTLPWTLQFHDAHRVSLFERWDRALPRHDPRGRDRRISCGAALENLVLAMRILGWDAGPALFADRKHPDEVARVTARGRREPSDVDLARYAVVSRRHSYRRPFAAMLVDPATQHALVTASGTSGVEVRALRGDEVAVLARVFSHAVLALRMNRAYQRELSAWTGSDPATVDVPDGPRLAAVPWPGLVRRSTAVPDLPSLVDRLRREYLLLIETPGDGPRDHVRAGMAAQSTWLAATAAGLVGSMLTQPLQVSEVRAGLIEGLFLPGFPQALLRLGHAADAP
jgi:nitroreductase